MKTKGQKILHGLAYFFAVIGVAAVVYSLFFTASSGVARVVSAQQDPFLSQRLNQIESRFDRLETRLNRLESESRLSAIRPSTPTDDSELRLVRSVLETMDLRLATLECGLLKLDERTLPNDVRQKRKNSAGAPETDRCRLNPNEPLQIIGRGAR